MEERRGARSVTQRHLEVDPDPPPSAPELPPKPELPPGPSAATRPADRPLDPSNAGLLDRQLRWQRERRKFESSSQVQDAAP